MSDIFESLEGKPIESQIFAMDKVISLAKKRGELFTDINAILANNYIISQYETKRNELVESLDITKIDYGSIEVIQSMYDEGSAKVKEWNDCFKLAVLLSK